MKRKYLAIGLFVFIGLLAKPAFAHREDYIGETLVFQTLEKGATEPEYWLDIGRRKQDGVFVRHTVAVEHGITGHWMVDGNVAFKSVSGKHPEFEAGRVETRLRFAGEGDYPVDTAFSFEMNREQEEDGTFATHAEPRLVLSKDLDAWNLNFTLNIPLEVNVKTGETALIPSGGFRFDVSHLIQLGTEARYDIDTHEGSVIPQIWFRFGHDITLKGGYFIGFDQSPDNYARLAAEFDF